MQKQTHIYTFGRLPIIWFMVLWCCVLSGCSNSSSSDEDDQVRVFETTGSPPEIETVEFYRYINGEYIEVEPELYATDAYIYHFSKDEYISFKLTASDPDLDMVEVTISTYDVFDMETGDPTEYYEPPLTGPDVHEIDWCELEGTVICVQPEEDVTFFLKNALKLGSAGFLGPRQIWFLINDLGNNSSNYYKLYARVY